MANDKEFKKGDKIIWNSHFGYEIGYFIEESKTQVYSYKVKMITGVVQEENTLSQNEIKKYSKELAEELAVKYSCKVKTF